MEQYSVTEINNSLKKLIEHNFNDIVIEGEISNLTYHSSGHIYFSLKDEKSTIRATMFRGFREKGLKFELQNGQKVLIYGDVSIYNQNSTYQIIAKKIEAAGIGNLAIAFEKLKEKLSDKGYFEQSIKKDIPKYPKHIILITSRTGAALQDMGKMIRKRWENMKVTLINTLVQGDKASNDIVESILIGDKLNADVMIVARGGGSKEDLWCFNEEIVADAIFNAKTPIVSAIGHEIDFMISDFVADLRAPTPSAAMEMILPDKNEILFKISDLIDKFDKNFLKKHKKNIHEIWILDENLNKEEIIDFCQIN